MRLTGSRSARSALNRNTLIIVMCVVIAPSAYRASPTGANLLTNGSLENGSTGLMLPTTFGVWQGDQTAVVTVTGDIAPPDGVKMLRFERTLWDTASGASSCDVWQLVDVSYLADGGTADLQVQFNRVGTGSAVDTQFNARIFAYGGTPDEFDDVSPAVPPPLDSNAVDLFSDADESSWEEVGVELNFPSATRYLAIAISAIENVENNTSGTELAGHYADAATLTIQASGSGPGSVPPDMLLERVSSTELRLSWTSSDCPGAQEYAIYEGTLGSWYSHVAIACSDDQGDFEEIVVASGVDTYYLVVPRTTQEEGSYGVNHFGQERPVGDVSCLPLQILGCP